MKKISEITRQKLKNYHKKYPINFWLGKKFSKKHLENMSKSQTGRKHSKETKEKMRVRAFENGNGKWNKGHKMSEKTLVKMRLCQKGKKVSEETKQKIKKARSKQIMLKGEKHPNWKGGITSSSQAARMSLEMKLFKKACLERDNFTCQKYETRGGILRVHHINNFADFPELRTSISNGITLSEQAHKEFHKIYGIKNNTREQLEEFLKENNIDYLIKKYMR